MSKAEIDRQIIELERLASTVLDIKRRSRPRRPIVIEFAGSPKAGKSSCIGSLDIFLRRNNFRTKILTERASVCPIPNKFDPVFNVWTACAALNQLNETLANSAKKLEVLFLIEDFSTHFAGSNGSEKKNFLETTITRDLRNFSHQLGFA